MAKLLLFQRKKDKDNEKPGDVNDHQQEQSMSSEPENEPDKDSAITLMHQLTRYLNKRVKKGKIGFIDMPVMLLIKLGTKDKLRDIKQAFESKSDTGISYHPQLLKDFLGLRRNLMAIVVTRAIKTGNKTENRKQTLQQINETLEDLSFTALHNEWDWVSFHELEFDYFFQIARLSNDSTLLFFLKRLREKYLTAALNMNRQFWEMTEAVDVYSKLLEAIEKNNEELAENILRKFFEKNDRMIMHFYEALAQNRL